MQLEQQDDRVIITVIDNGKVCLKTSTNGYSRQISAPKLRVWDLDWLYRARSLSMQAVPLPSVHNPIPGLNFSLIYLFTMGNARYVAQHFLYSGI